MITCALAPGLVRASETSTLDTRNGDHIQGECVTVEGGVLMWRTVYGDSIRVPVAKIATLQTSAPWDLVFSDGQVLRGSWSVADGVLLVQTSLFGALRCPVEALRSGSPAVQARGVQAERTTAEAPAPSAPSAGTGPASAPKPPEPSREAPPSSLQTMLRQSSILLRPKEWSVSTGLNYAHNRTLYAPNDYRQWSLVNQLQYGVTPKLQAALEWPVTFTHTSTVSPADTPGEIRTSGSTKLRAGDPELSGAALLFSEGRVRPECILAAGLTVPVNPASEGGVFRSRVGLEFLKTSDPGALFLGFAWLRDGDGWESSRYRSIDSLTYHVGAAIGLNDELAVGFQAQGRYMSEVRSKNGALLSTSQEPVQGRFWFNFRTAQKTFIETSITLPVSSDAHTATFGFNLIQRY